MSIELKTTQRGFSIGEFVDHCGETCSIQKSSLAGVDCIWLGISEPEPKFCVYGQDWFKYEMPEGVLISGRMHLTREMAADLIPLLQRFVETGEFCESEPAKSPERVMGQHVPMPTSAIVNRRGARHRVRFENVQAGDFVERVEHLFGMDWGFSVIEGEVVEGEEV